jgi:hypothetical protein
MLFQYIDKIAVELEGIYLKRCIEDLLTEEPDDVKVKEDGSIHVNKGIEVTTYNNKTMRKEETNISFGVIDESIPVERAGGLLGRELIPKLPYSDLEDLKRWIIKYYPVAINETCGFHVHTSFKSTKHYNNLMEEEFYKFFLEKMKNFANTIEYSKDKERLIYRLSGWNRFARKAFIPDYQCKEMKGDYFRYTQLNFSYRVHNTIECRLFPMFTRVETALAAVEKLIETYNDYLNKLYKSQDKKEKAIITKSIPITGGNICV